ncbi:annexin A7-like [Dermacentor silvarum]|uniref:annexin A7-like n=1 Tax=Dermacentor silvarum TaxID=543639 RepID=UPI002100BA71|nr:annexin A7-like [Dermacentor silvarum]
MVVAERTALFTMLQASQGVHCFQAGSGMKGTSGNANRGYAPPPYSPRYTTSSSSYPPGPPGSAGFDGLQRPSGAPPPGFAVSSSTATERGYPPTMSPGSTAGQYPPSQPGGYPPPQPGGYPPPQPGGYPPPQSGGYPPPQPGGYPPPQPGGYPPRNSSVTMLMPGAPPLSPLNEAPSFPELPTQARSFPTPSSSSTSIGDPTDKYPSPSALFPVSARPRYETPTAAVYPASDYSSSSRAASGYYSLGYASPATGAQYASASSGTTSGGTKDLMGDAKSTVRSNFEDVIMGLLYPLHEYLARQLRKAIVGLGTDEECLIEILCTHSNEDIRLIKDYYRRIFKKELETDVIGDTSGDFRRLLVSMCNAQREEDTPLDHDRARNDAALLYRAGVLRWGTDVSAFNRIIASQSYEQLRLVFREYNALANHTVMEAIKSEMSGDLRRGFLAIVKCVYSPPFYFAEKLYYSMKGLGTNNKVLKRVILSRCERDLELIKEEYFDKYKVTLASAIQAAALQLRADDPTLRQYDGSI